MSGSKEWSETKQRQPVGGDHVCRGYWLLGRSIGPLRGTAVCAVRHSNCHIAARDDFAIRSNGACQSRCDREPRSDL